MYYCADIYVGINIKLNLKRVSIVVDLLSSNAVWTCG
jgi:hypothetical protein